jgi:hypothetical protein
MASIASDMVGSLNQLVDENRELDVLVTYSIFSETYQPIFADKPIKEVERFQLHPTNTTALIESACKMIDEVGARLAAKSEDERPEKVMFVIVTDGLENASAPEYTKERLFEKIKHQSEVYNWLFLYLGANQDAIEVAQSYGIDASKALTFAACQDGISRNKERLSKKLQQMVSASVGKVQDIFFDYEDRKE